MIHRDYFLHRSIHLTLHDGRAKITSPGGFTGGVAARNVLRHPPVRRNPLLADVLQAIGLVNRAGLGVDRICEEMLLLGKDLPRYDADESHVRLVLPTRTYARFVHEVRRGGPARLAPRARLSGCAGQRSRTHYRLARRHAGLVDAAVPTEDDVRVDEESVRPRLIALVIKEFRSAPDRQPPQNVRFVTPPPSGPRSRPSHARPSTPRRSA